MRWTVMALLATVCSLFIASGAGAVATPPFTVVMTGLDSPRGLAWSPEGALYVAEAGRGGHEPCFPGPDGGPQFGGFTGGISRLQGGVQQRVATGLPSVAAADGTGALGPHDVAPIGGGAVRFTIGLGTNPANRAICGSVGPKLGWTGRLSSSGSWSLETDLAAYEAAANPDGGLPDSDPYGLLPQHGSTVATDAGGNSLVRVTGGSVSTIATFPSRAQGRFTDSVPTTVAVGPDGAYYVGELTGAPFVPGQARIYRVVPGQPPTIYKSHFSFIIDIAWGPGGNLYVLQFANGPGLSGPGELWRIAPTGARTLVATGFIASTSVAIGPDGAFYVSNCGVFPSTGPSPCGGLGGQVVRFTG
ncbi:MAG: hypothetical protein QOE13_1775 [Gaiellaceae bacterium]|nr:hypothetical protein [Gaiellaceae bacterium]